MSAVEIPTHLPDGQAQVAELREAVLSLPDYVLAVLRRGPAPEPLCTLCMALDTAPESPESPARALIHDYHAVSVFHVRELIGEGAVEAMKRTSLADPVVKALGGALAAERCRTVYLLAGWQPEVSG